MTVIMLGVVQVFAIVTRTASEAEGIHFAQQQLRAVFDRLHNDLRGVTREGYLKINRLEGTDPTVASSPRYHRDTLAFATIGRCASTFASNAYEATAAEVVYTSNVRTPTTVLTVDPGGQSRQVDARRGILGRGQWLMSGEPPGTAHPLQDTSAASYLCDMFEDQQKSGGGSDDRVSKMGWHLQVYPWTVIEGLPSQHAETLRRVMASCVSEFYVETFNPPAGGGGGGTADYFQNIAGTYTWRGTTGATIHTRTWPRAIRVTIAVHDPGDTSPPQKYSDNTVKPFRGFVLQEVFWLGDP